MPVNAQDISVDEYGIVFSGGGALGAWEVGALQPIFDFHGGKWPRVVTGASAGALNAAGLCAGLTPDDLAREWAALKNDDVFTQGIKVRKSAAQVAGHEGWNRASRFIRNLLPKSGKGGDAGAKDDAGTVDTILHVLRGHRGFYDTAPFEATLKRILKGREHTFLSSPLRLAISTTKLADGEVELFYKIPHTETFPPQAATGTLANAWREIAGMTELIQALKGTTALPLLFPPMEGRFDGGVLMNQPISPALRFGVRRIYVLIPSPETFHPTENLKDIGTSLLTNWLSTSLEAQIRMVKVISWTDQAMLNALVAKGDGDTPAANAIRDRLIQLVVVRPPHPLEDDPSVGLLKFGGGVEAMIAAAKRSTEERLERFDPAIPQTWDNYLRDPKDYF